MKLGEVIRKTKEWRDLWAWINDLLMTANTTKDPVMTLIASTTIRLLSKIPEIEIQDQQH